MRNMIKTQKGFIPTLLVIVIVASIAVTSTGVVLHKTGKLTPFVANVAQIFEGTESREIESNEEIVGQTQEIQEEQPEELEEVRLEAEKAIQETEKARAEAERLRKEMEEAKRLEEERRQREVEELRKQQETQRLAEEQRRQQELKIEQCKAQAQLRVDNFLTAGKATINEGFKKCVQSRFDTLQQQLDTPIPGTMGDMIEIARSSCTNSAQEGLNFLETKADEIYNQQYIECLNR